MNNKALKIGLDFDGVIAYNPFRVIRAPIALFKQYILQKKSLNFFYPQNKLQKTLFIILHKSSILPAAGVTKLRELKKTRNCEIHLVTARYSFLDRELYTWLEKHSLLDIFDSININIKDEQPHLFKERLLRELELDYFIEDNLDIVRHLKNTVTTKVYWVYNFLDITKQHDYKVKNLKQALDHISKL